MPHVAVTRHRSGGNPYHPSALGADDHLSPGVGGPPPPPAAGAAAPPPAHRRGNTGGLTGGEGGGGSGGGGPAASSRKDGAEEAAANEAPLAGHVGPYAMTHPSEHRSGSDKEGGGRLRRREARESATSVVSVLSQWGAGAPPAKSRVITNDASTLAARGDAERRRYAEGAMTTRGAAGGGVGGGCRNTAQGVEWLTDSDG